mgnify:CR=1 FL=1
MIEMIQGDRVCEHPTMADWGVRAWRRHVGVGRSRSHGKTMTGCETGGLGSFGGRQDEGT